MKRGEDKALRQRDKLWRQAEQSERDCRHQDTRRVEYAATELADRAIDGGVVERCNNPFCNVIVRVGL